jgi:bacteriocin biosynthesis cyclodehydratase domain-containing protein
VAAAVRVGRISIVSGTAFGRAVATQLKRLANVESVRIDTAITATRPHRPDLIAVISEWEVRSILLEADRYALAELVPWLPVVIESERVRCGPLVVPGTGGTCYSCFLARRAQHRQEGSLDEQRLEAYDRGDSGPTGYLPSNVTMAAGMILGFLERDLAPGTMVHASLIKAELVRSVIIGTPGCPRCDTSSNEIPMQGFRLGVRAAVGI